MKNSIRASAEQYAYDSLKQALYERRLAPGAALTEQSICSTLGVGRTPARAALRRLADDGFVEIIPNRGAFVTSITKDQFWYFYDARIELHMIALRRGIDHFTEADYKRMEETIEKENDAFENMRFQEYLDCVGNFYAIIMQKSENPLLEEMYWLIYNRMRIYLVLYDNFYMPMRKKLDSVPTHTLIIDAIKRRDLEELENILRNHSQMVINNLQFDHTAAANLQIALK